MRRKTVTKQVPAGMILGKPGFCAQIARSVRFSPEIYRKIELFREMVGKNRTLRDICAHKYGIILKWMFIKAIRTLLRGVALLLQ